MAAAESVGNLSKHVDEKRVRELVRRTSIPIQPDGYPSSSMPEPTSGGGHSDSTFGTVLAKEKPRRDPVLGDLRRLYSDLEKAEGLLKGCVGRLDEIDRKVEERVERAVSTPCAVCQELPASKAGFCASDHLDWWRHGRPDRQRWELYRKKQVNSEGLLLVSECPPPSEGNVAVVGPYRKSDKK